MNKPLNQPAHTITGLDSYGALPGFFIFLADFILCLWTRDFSLFHILIVTNARFRKLFLLRKKQLQAQTKNHQSQQ